MTSRTTAYLQTKLLIYQHSATTIQSEQGHKSIRWSPDLKAHPINTEKPQDDTKPPNTPFEPLL